MTHKYTENSTSNQETCKKTPKKFTLLLLQYFPICPHLLTLKISPKIHTNTKIDTDIAVDLQPYPHHL